MVAGAYGFVYNKKLYKVTAARDIQYSEYDIGHLHNMYILQDAIKKQLRECDFLKGDEPYKFHWTKSARKYMQIIMFEKDFCFGLKLKALYVFLRLYAIRQHGLREYYSFYRIRRRENKQRKSMGL